MVGAIRRSWEAWAVRASLRQGRGARALAGDSRAAVRPPGWVCGSQAAARQPMASAASCSSSEQYAAEAPGGGACSSLPEEASRPMYTPDGRYRIDGSEIGCAPPSANARKRGDSERSLHPSYYRGAQ